MKGRNPFAGLMLAALFLPELAGCGGAGGGGGGSSGSTVTVGTGETNTGSVSANFVSGAVPRYMLIGNGNYSAGSAVPVVQDGSGAIATLSSYSLTGTETRTHEIAGDTSFAQGRWVYGTVTDNGVAIATLEGSRTSRNWHYIVYNQLSEMPTSTTNTSCDSGTFSTPTWYGGSAISVNAVTTGSATLSFAGGVATVDVSLLSSADGADNTLSVSSISLPTVGSIGGGGGLFVISGTWLTVGDGGNGQFRIVGVYATVLSNGAQYLGVYSFKCTPI